MSYFQFIKDDFKNLKQSAKQSVYEFFANPKTVINEEYNNEKSFAERKRRVEAIKKICPNLDCDENEVIKVTNLVNKEFKYELAKDLFSYKTMSDLLITSLAFVSEVACFASEVYFDTSEVTSVIIPIVSGVVGLGTLLKAGFDVVSSCVASWNANKASKEINEIIDQNKSQIDAENVINLREYNNDDIITRFLARLGIVDSSIDELDYKNEGYKVDPTTEDSEDDTNIAVQTNLEDVESGFNNESKVIKFDPSNFYNDGNDPN